jgi:hypothetical protein
MSEKSKDLSKNVQRENAEGKRAGYLKRKLALQFK